MNCRALVFLGWTLEHDIVAGYESWPFWDAGIGHGRWQSEGVRFTCKSHADPQRHFQGNGG